MATRLLGLHTVVPKHHGSQEQAARFMGRVIHESATSPERERALVFVDRIYSQSGIRRRYSAIGDFVARDPSCFEFFPSRWDLEPVPTTAQRMRLYEDASVELAQEAAAGALKKAAVSPEEITHLIICTCTGFFAPGPDIELCKRLQLKSTVSRTIVGFMGCYAGFNGMRAVDQIVCGDPEAVVLQVCVELCSLHFQKSMTPDSLVVNSLFGDGCAATVYGDAARYDRGLADLRATRSDVEAGTEDQMSWRIGNHGFEMRLATTVPQALKRNIGPFVDILVGTAGLSAEEIQGWALHPGGRKILEELRDALGLKESDVRESFEVLSEYGNMSSATIFFVLEKCLRCQPPGTPLVALGFGPGLTIEGAVFEGL